MKKTLFYITLLPVLILSGMDGLNAQQVSNPASNLPLEPNPTTPQEVPYPGMYNLRNYSKVNFVRTTIPDAVMPTNIGTPIPFRQTTAYLDGLGRPLQTVARRAYEDGYDIINPYVYEPGTGREVYQYLPFVIKTVQSDGSLLGIPNAGLRIFYDHNGPDEQPYSKTETDNSPLNRVTNQMAPGQSWVGAGRGKRTDYLSNTVADGVRIFTIGPSSSDLPQTGSTYAAGELIVTKTTDEDGKYDLEYKDKRGRVILTKAWLNGTTGHNGFACTYYVYDNLGRQRYVIPPQAVAMVASTWNLSGVTELCYSYVYDGKGRIIEKKIPGKEKEFLIYDKRDRLVFRQDGNLRTGEKKYAFTLYDALDRPIATGLQTQRLGDGELNNVQMQQALDVGIIQNGNIFQYCNDYTLFNTYPPKTGPGYEILSYTYYDDYSQSTNLEFRADPLSTMGITSNPVDLSQPSTQTRGLVTGGNVVAKDPENTNADAWLQSAIYYDENGRIMQTRSQNLPGGIETSSNTYYFQGQLAKNTLEHENQKATQITPDGAHKQIKLQTTYNYDFRVGGGRAKLKGMTQKIDDGITYPFANFYYDHMGRSVVKQMPAVNVLNEYNLRGFLTHINVGNTFVDYADSNHIFEENLYYDKGFASRLFNGNIAGITWRQAGNNAPVEAYGYSYDNLDRLTHAQYGRKTGIPWWWPNTDYDYTVSGIDYDLNGNIQHMNQRGINPPVINIPIDMDQLTYTYATGSNQLIKVQDAVAPSATESLPDFKDNANNSTEYTYDGNGNMVTDANKGIVNPITYSLNNKPNVIQNGKGRITYIYDAGGNCLRKKVFTLATNITDVYDYIGNFVYKNDSLQYFSTTEGRARPTQDTFGHLKFVYDYFVKDHLNNVRSTVTASPMNNTYLARHEISLANTEQLVFDNIPWVRDGKPVSTDPGDRMAARLNGSDRQVGTAIMLKTMPGDRYTINVDAYYKGDFKSDGDSGPETIVQSLISALTGGSTYAGVPIAEMPENVRTIQNALGNPELVSTLAQLTQNDDPARPKAHINVLFFDEKFKLRDGNSICTQVPWNAMNQWTNLGPAFPMTNAEVGVVSDNAGYVIIFIDNQSVGKDVWFDNLMIEHYTGQVMEQDHYYPFGLTVQTGADPNHKAQPFKYNSKELEKGIGLELYNYGARMQDPQLGIWHSPDPLAEKFRYESPFSYAGNNPIKNMDRGGLHKVSAENEKEYWEKYPKIMSYLSNQFESDIAKSSKIVNGLVQTNPNIKPSTVKAISKWGKGPEITFVKDLGEFPYLDKNAAGFTEKETHTIQLNSRYASYVEKKLNSDASADEKLVAFSRLFMTLVHETGHELNKYGPFVGSEENGSHQYVTAPGGYSKDEQGLKAEENIWGTADYKPYSDPKPSNGPGVLNLSPEKYQPGVTEKIIEEARKTEDGRNSLPTVPE